VTTVILNRNYGQHAALLAGFAETRGDLVVTLDADLQNPPEEIPRLVAAAEEGYEVVGSIRMRRQDSLFRKLASRLINRFMQRLTGVGMSDYGCMLRAYRSSIVETMLACEERSTFIGREGVIDFFHYDFYAQALAKIERGHNIDLLDVRRMIELGLVEPSRLPEFFSQIEDRLYKYPAIDPKKFRAALETFLKTL